MKMLTDKELESFEHHGASSGTGTAPLLRDCIVRACSELRALRALLATEMPCGWPEPFAELKFKTPYVSWDCMENGEPSLIDPDEAIALGAALIRAGQQAKGEKQ